MSLDTGAVVGIAVAAAFAGVLLTIILLQVAGRCLGLSAPTKKTDEEEVDKAEIDKTETDKEETRMGPVIREENSEAHRTRKKWMEGYDEYDLIKNEPHMDEFKDKWWVDYRGGADGLNFDYPFRIPRHDLLASLGLTAGEGNDPAPHDISAALSHYFDGWLELGIDHRIIAKLLFHTDRSKRITAIEFLMNKAALSFCNWGSNPKYSILPPEMMELAEELRVRGPKSLNNFQDRLYNWKNPDPFDLLYSRWRVLTCAMYGRHGIPPAVQISIDRRVDFLMTVLNPIINPEKLARAREYLLRMMEDSYNLAIFCVDQRSITINSWDYTDQSKGQVIYMGEPEQIPAFDMMAEKTLVLCPAWLQVASPLTAMPFIRPYALQPAELVKFTDLEWEELTKDF